MPLGQNTAKNTTEDDLSLVVFLNKNLANLPNFFSAVLNKLDMQQLEIEGGDENERSAMDSTSSSVYVLIRSRKVR